MRSREFYRPPLGEEVVQGNPLFLQPRLLKSPVALEPESVREASSMKSDKESDKEEVIRGIQAIYNELHTLSGRIHVASRRHDLRDVELPQGCHIHNFWEIKIVSGGPLLYESPFERFHVPDGHVLLVPPEVVHVAYRFGSERLAKGARYFYTGSRYEKSREVGIQYASNHVFHTLTFREMKRLDNLIGLPLQKAYERLADPSQRGDPDHYSSNLLKLILSSLLRVLHLPSDNPQSSAELLLHRVNELLRAHFSNPGLSLNEIADTVGMNPCYLTSLYKRHQRRSLWQTVQQLRFENAEKLLKKRKFSIREIAQLSGWSSPLYFTRVFHRHYGMPPSRYRLEHPGAEESSATVDQGSSV